MDLLKLTTVTGSVSAADIGFCQCHEHLFISRGKSYELSPVLWMDEVERSAADAADFLAAGGKTIVDAQPIGCGRMAKELKAVSEMTGVNILASTGFHKMVFYPEDHWIFTASEDELAKIFTDELTVGMYVNCDNAYPTEQTDIKAGLIKTALDKEFTPQYEKVFRAAIRASLNTGATIMTHIEEGSDPMALLDILLDAGVPAKHIIFCHTDRALDDIPAIKALAARGIYLEMDTIGRFKYHSDEREVEIFNALIDTDHSDQLLFSLDSTRARLKSYTEDAIGLDYLIKTFIPMLKEANVSDADLTLISHKNCVRAFGR